MLGTSSNVLMRLYFVVKDGMNLWSFPYCCVQLYEYLFGCSNAFGFGKDGVSFMLPPICSDRICVF